MCARRFLFIVAILAIIAVAGSFAIFQFGQDILVKSATPRGHFEAPPASTRPDYADASSWIARPDVSSPGNPSFWRPADWPPQTLAPLAPLPAAVFYVHPTTYLERDRWNARLREDGQTEARARLFVQSQASAFNGVGEIWAPRYRQAAYGAFLLDSRDAAQALDLAYGDVLAAFDRFIAEVPAGRPIVLAGHSQGSLHLLRLLADRRAVLTGRLVAAYVVGWPVSTVADLPATGLFACVDANSSGCIASWQSFGEPANPSLILDAWAKTPGRSGPHRRRDVVCTDPIGGTNNGGSPPADNPGTLIPDGDLANASLRSGQVGGRCDKGILLIDGTIPPLGPYVLPGNNYHVYDYALFWGAVRRDAARRLTAWQAR
ncbi:MAG: DUF3089 domain-containing protein [Sphingomicrobium sp.]